MLWEELARLLANSAKWKSKKRKDPVGGELAWCFTTFCVATVSGQPSIHNFMPLCWCHELAWYCSQSGTVHQLIIFLCLFCQVPRMGRLLPLELESVPQLQSSQHQAASADGSNSSSSRSLIARWKMNTAQTYHQTPQMKERPSPQASAATANSMCQTAATATTVGNSNSDNELQHPLRPQMNAMMQQLQQQLQQEVRRRLQLQRHVRTSNRRTLRK